MASLAAHQVDARTGQAPNAYIDPIVFTAWRGIIKDVLNVQPCCRASEDEWPYHLRSIRPWPAPELIKINPMHRARQLPN